MHTVTWGRSGLAGGCVALALVTACSNGNSVGTSSTTAADSPSSVGEAPTLSAPGALTSFAALQGDWDTAHVPAPQYAPGSAYDLDPTLDPAASPPLVRYGGVQASDGRVLDYNVYLHPPMTSATALAAAQAELPADATLIWQRDAGTCLEFQFTSSTLAAISTVGTSGGVFVAAFPSDTPPWITLSLGNYASADNGPEC